MPQHGPGNSGFAPGADPSNPLGAAWTADLAGGRGMPPTVVDGVVYSPAFDAGLYALDAADGTEMWHGLTEVDGTVATAPAVVDGTVYVGGSDHSIIAADAADGEVLWTLPEDDIVSVSPPTVVGDTVYVSRDDGKVFALATDSGEPRWVGDIPEGAPRHPPAVVDGTAHVVTDDGVTAFDATTGETEWTASLESVPASGVAAGHGRRYLLVQRQVVALDATTGETEWTAPMPSLTFLTPTVVSDGVLVTGAGHVTRLDPGDGSEVWSFPEGRRENTSTLSSVGAEMTGPVAATEAAAYVVAGKSTLYELDARTGSVEQSVELDAAVRSAPVVADESVYLKGTDESVIALRAEGDGAVGSAPPTGEDGGQGDDLTTAWLEDWYPLLAVLAGVPVLGSLVLGALVALTRDDEDGSESA
jgi:outer membrane protein assembly factor BamB